MKLCYNINMFNKLKSLIILITLIFTSTLTTSFNSFATADPSTGGGGGGGSDSPTSYVDGTCNYILGLTSWNCGVDIHDGETLKRDIWVIVTNIAIDITVIAAYLVLGYVIYGGYLYMFSDGETGKIVSGKKTLNHAFIGLAIVMSANIIMSTIRFALLGSNGNLADCARSSCINPNDLATNLIQWVIGIAGVAAAIFIVQGAIAYITSSGDPSKLQKAKNTITYALIGLAIVALAEIITAFVSNMIRQANNDTAVLPSATIISKESHEKNI